MSTELLRRPEAASVSEPRLRRGVVAEWLWENKVDIAIVLVLLAVLGVVHADGMFSFPARFDDEGAYMSQTWAVLTRFDLSHYTYWYDHPPLGWLILAAYSGLSGSLWRTPYGVAAGREAMLVFHLASLALLYVLARRLGMRRMFAILVVLLFGLSPLGIFFHRMVLLDNIAMPLLLGGFVLLLSPKRRLGAHVAAAAAFALAFLVREILVVFLPFAIWVYVSQTEPENRRYSLALTSTTFIGILLMYPTFAILRGELFPGPDRVSLFGAIAWQLFDRQGSGSIFDPASPAGEVLTSWMTLDPWILVLGSLSAVILLFTRRLRWLGAIVVLMGLMLLRPGYLPVMFVLPVLPFLALAVGGALDESWSKAAPPIGSASGSLANWVRRGIVVSGVVILVVAVFPSYHAGVDRAMAFDADQPFREAQHWLQENLEPDDIVFVDGALWLDIVQSGHPVENTIWFYKLDSDPGVDVEGGWREVDYIVSSEVMRNSVYDLPQMDQALRHSEVIETFGGGEGRVEIRRIDPS